MSIGQRLLAATVACATAIAAPALAQPPSLETAITLYAAASYDDALEALERARQGRLSPGDRVELERHRMLCLLALGRTAAAADAAADLLEQQPGYWLSEGEAAPHVRALLEATRSRVVPGMMRRTYESGKRPSTPATTGPPAMPSHSSTSGWRTRTSRLPIPASATSAPSPKVSWS